MLKELVICFPVSRRLTDPAVAPGPYVLQKGDVPRGAGLSVNVIDHVELDYKVPSGYGPENMTYEKGFRTYNTSGRIGFMPSGKKG